MYVYLIIQLVQKLLHEVPSRYLAHHEWVLSSDEGYTFWLETATNKDSDTWLIYEGASMHDMEATKLGALCHFCGEFTYEFGDFCSESCSMEASYDYFNEVMAEEAGKQARFEAKLAEAMKNMEGEEEPF